MNQREQKNTKRDILQRAVMVRGWVTMLQNVCAGCAHCPDRVDTIVKEIDALIDLLEMECRTKEIEK